MCVKDIEIQTLNLVWWFKLKHLKNFRSQCSMKEICLKKDKTCPNFFNTELCKFCTHYIFTSKEVRTHFVYLGPNKFWTLIFRNLFFLKKKYFFS